MVRESHGTHTIKTAGKVLIVDVSGPFNEESVKEYQTDLESFVERLSSTPWALCGIFRNQGLLTPDAEASLIEVTRWRKERGMAVISVVLKDVKEPTILKAQMNRIYSVADIQCGYFDKMSDALSWLTEKGYPSYS